MPQVFLYDTTLRDGAQGEGISLSLADKLKILRKLDQFGMHYVEGGWPGANPKDSEFFARARALKLKHARLTAFASTRRPGGAVESDPTVAALLEAGTPVVAVVGKSWRLHVTDVLRTTLDENLAMIGETCAYLKAQGREVVYDAEHFFDGYKDDPVYALASLRAAHEGGADWLALCDTNGGSLPSEVGRIVAAVAAALPGARVGIHTHNDGELAVANSLAAVEAGATQVQGTVNGYGERVGNANLVSVAANLKLKMGVDCVSDAALAGLTELSHFVADVANQVPNSHQPFVGASAFAHKAGLHVNAVLKTAASFEHVDPGLVGNHQRILVSEVGGRDNVRSKLAQLGIDLGGDEAALRRVSALVKEQEARGFQYEAAEASFELLVRRSLPDYAPPFELLDVLVLVEKRRGVEMLAEATIKVRVRAPGADGARDGAPGADGERDGQAVLHTAAEGDGPVHALDGALRKALLERYPQLARVELVDFKVRVVDQAAGTGATVRVSIESSDGEGAWSTVGSSPNIIEASWLALADSMEYALLRAARRARHYGNMTVVR
jgi:2-isopropylmalate synthase